MSDKLPLISVIITSYNRVSLVPRAIDSAGRQTYKNIEIVVVDDASSDNTVEVINHLNNPLVRVIRNENNLGASGAKNVGVAAANGDYIAFLDSDDTWNNNKLEIQYNALQENKAIQLCFTATRIHRNSGKIVTRIAQRKNSWYKSIMYSETFSLGSTLLASKECMNRIGPINETLVRFEDRDWCIRYFDHYNDFLYISEPLVDVYNSSGWASIDIVRNSAARILELNQNRITDRSQEDYQIFCSSMEFEVAVSCWRNRKRIQGIWMGLRACVENPGFLKYILYRIKRKIKYLDFF